MKFDLAARLSEATRLTRARKLFEATRLIQQTLSNDASATSAMHQHAPARLAHLGVEPPDSASDRPFLPRRKARV